MGGGAFIVGGEGHGFVLAVVPPQVLGRAALVTLGGAALPVPAREEDGVPVTRVRRFGGLGKRHDLALALRIEQDHAIGWENGAVKSDEGKKSEKLCVGRILHPSRTIVGESGESPLRVTSGS